MDNITNRIKLNNDLWFNVQPDKIIFGGAFLTKGLHLTFPFGIKSGNFDLHLTKGNIQFPIIIIKHSDFQIIQQTLIDNLLNSFLNNLKPLTKDLLNNKDYKIYALSGFDSKIDESFKLQISQGINNLKNSKTTKRLNIDKNSQKFQEFTKELKSKQEIKNIELSEFLRFNNALGMAISNENSYFLIKDKLTRNIPSMFDFINLDTNRIIKDTLGEDLSNYILETIERGKIILEKDNAQEIIRKMIPPILTIKTNS
ncbi:MAG: hypothetical protein WC389_04280 [Lutibacter sp.]|jgi:hypothetical protein